MRQTGRWPTKKRGLAPTGWVSFIGKENALFSWQTPCECAGAILEVRRVLEAEPAGRSLSVVTKPTSEKPVTRMPYNATSRCHDGRIRIPIPLCAVCPVLCRQHGHASSYMRMQPPMFNHGIIIMRSHHGIIIHGTPYRSISGRISDQKMLSASKPLPSESTWLIAS